MQYFIAKMLILRFLHKNFVVQKNVHIFVTQIAVKSNVKNYLL